MNDLPKPCAPARLVVSRPVALVSMLVVLAGCGASRARTDAAAHVNAHNAAQKTRPEAASSGERLKMATPPTTAEKIDCSLAYAPRQSWTDNFFEMDFAFSAYRVRPGNGPWSPAKLAECDRVRRQLVKPGQQLECYDVKGGEAGGTWAILSSDPTDADPHSKWEVAYARDGHLVTSPWHEASSGYGDPAVSGNAAPSSAAPIAVFDVDGDGKEEFFTATDLQSDAAGNRVTTVTVWTATTTGIEPYAPTAALRAIAIADPNQDGRPELLINPYQFSVIGSGMSGWLKDRASWSLAVGFGANGKLTWDGPASRRYARQLCPSPEGLLEQLPKVDPACVAGYVQCARLWGTATAVIVSAIDAFCANEAKTASPGAGWCEVSSTAWNQIANQEPPFVLQK